MIRFIEIILILFILWKDIAQVNENIPKLSNGFPSALYETKNMEDCEEMLLMSCWIMQ